MSTDFYGHGIGPFFHQLPFVGHHLYEDRDIMEQGMTFTIEPILCQGMPRFKKWPDGWTAVTRDGGRAAQFEHTVLLEAHGPVILT